MDFFDEIAVVYIVVIIHTTLWIMKKGEKSASSDRVLEAIL